MVTFFNVANATEISKENEIHCMALNIYHEARGSIYKDKIAVAWVTKNRSTNYNKSICSVVYEKNQFSWTKKSHGFPKEIIEWEESKKLANQVLANNIGDITNGATYFVDLSIHYHWMNKAKNKIIIGNHLFFKI